MSGSRFVAEAIVGKLRDAYVLISKVRTVAQTSKQIGVTDQTYVCWRWEYGGLESDQLKALKERER